MNQLEESLLINKFLVDKDRKFVESLERVKFYNTKNKRKFSLLKIIAIIELILGILKIIITAIYPHPSIFDSYTVGILFIIVSMFMFSIITMRSL